jgi:flagellar motor switch protein FliG
MDSQRDLRLPKAQPKLKGIERAAIVLMALGEDHAAEILKHLEPRELHKLGATMANLISIERDQVSEALREFNQQITHQTSIGMDRQNFVRSVLVRALGRDKAKGIMENILEMDSDSAGVGALKWMDASAIAGGLSTEHPQVVALVLSSLEPKQAAEVVNMLPEELRSEAILRVAVLDEIPSGALSELNELIEKQMMTKITASTTSKIGGPRRAAEILNLLDGAVESKIIDKVKEQDRALGDKIEELMMVFDSLLSISDRDIQSLLREISSDILLVALRGADEVVRDKILRNMSARAAALVRDDLEIMPPVRLSEVEAAQREILATAKRLAETGEITLKRGDDQLV